MREYTVDEKGIEHIFQFALEGWTISDLYRFMTRESATYHIDALEDSELLLITKSAREEIFKSAPKYETFSRMQLTGAYLAMQKRITSIIGLSLEDRHFFSRNYILK
jgi:hypothetical protein